MTPANNISFTFVLPAYKLRFLKQAIDSILNQTDEDFKLIVVNDKSQENIMGLMESYNDDRIEYHENEANIGRNDLVASWNHCLQFVDSEYVCLASDDDMYEPNFLSDVKGLIRCHPECDLIRGRVQKIDEEGNELDYDIEFPTWQNQAEFIYFYASHAIRCAANYVYKLKPLMEQGGFVPLPCGWFTDIATPMANSGKGVLNTQKIVFRFRLLKSESVSSNISFSVIEKKLHACRLYCEWLSLFFNQIESTHCMKSAHYVFRLEIVAMLKRLMRDIPFCHISLWVDNVLKNEMLYGYEKLDIIWSRLLKH